MTQLNPPDWRTPLLSADPGKRPRWEPAIVAMATIGVSNAHELRFADFFLLIEYGFRLAADVVVDERNAIPTENVSDIFAPIGAEGEPLIARGARDLSTGGYSANTAARMSTARQLHRFAVYVRDLLFLARERHASIGTSPPASRSADFPIGTDPLVVDLLRNANVPVPEQFKTLEAMCNLLGANILAYLTRAYVILRPEKTSGKHAAGLSRHVFIFLANMIGLAREGTGLPLILALFDRQFCERLDDLADLVIKRYPEEQKDDFRKAMQANYPAHAPDNDRYIVVDPETAVAVGLMKLLPEAVKAFDANDKARQEFTTARQRYERLLRQNRPNTAVTSRMEYASVHDFVAPPYNEDQWPGSVPEAEQLARRYVMHALEQVGQTALPKEGGWCVQLSQDDRVLALRVPESSAPGANGRAKMRLQQFVGRNPLMAWMTLPSTSADLELGQFFSDSGTASRDLQDLVDQAESREQAAKFRQLMIELLTIGATGAMSEPAIKMLLPGLSEIALKGIGAVAGHVVVQVAKQTVTSRRSS